MNYSFMTFSCPTLSFEEALRMAKMYGYNGIEPRITAKHEHGIEPDADDAHLADCKASAEAAGIAICCIATSCRYANPETAAQNVEDTRRAIELAVKLGAPCLRVFGGGFPEDISREAAIDGLVAALGQVAGDAAAAGVTLCFETHDSWTDPEHVATVVRAVDSPAVQVNWDIMHPVRQSGYTIADSYAILKPWVKHLHVHDGSIGDKLELRPIGEGDIDHRTALELLLRDGYEGFISGEWIGWEPFEVHLPREIMVLKRYERELSV